MLPDIGGLEFIIEVNSMKKLYMTPVTVYSAKDFLDVICVLVNPNIKIDESLWK